MNDIEVTINNYIACWNETDASRRRELIARTWADDATYLDPLMSGDGPDGINVMLERVQEQFPDYRFRLAGAIDTHHDRVRFGWELTAGDDQPPLVAGLDFGEIAADGRLRSITGFLDQAPVAAGA